MADTIAKTDRPAKKPVWIPSLGMNLVQTNATNQATAIFVKTNVPWR